MSLRDGSLKSSLLVALMFTVGMTAGAGWKLGWIPISLTNPTAGLLEEAEQTRTEDVRLPSEELTRAEHPTEAAPDWVSEQGEPPVQEGINQRVIDVEESLATQDDERVHVPVIRSKPSSPEPSPAEPQPRSDAPALSAFRRVKPANYETEAAPVYNTKSPEPEFNAPVAELPAASRFAEVDEKLAAGEILAAHKLLSKMYWSSQGNDADLQERLEESAKKIFFSPQPHFIDPYVVQSGDQLRKIATKYQLSWEYVSQLNRIDPKRIREGQKLKVLKGPFAAIVHLHDFSLTVHLQGYYVKRYLVGIGKDSSSPLGKFSVLEKLEDPQYTDPDGKVIEGGDAKNPLGKRWIDLGNSYGIHGTIDPDSIGKAESRGCIRLRDQDILEVYNFLVKGSVVELRE